MPRESKAVFEIEGARDESDKFISNRRSNVKSDLIEITEDKLENILMKHLDNLKLQTAWIAPLSVFVALLASLLTATFKETFGIKAPTWSAIFIISCVASIVWLIVTLCRLVRRRKSTTIESLLNRIKAVEKSEQEGK